jgi:uncharacterized protein (TIGR02246 family)
VHPVEAIIRQADRAIVAEDFGTLLQFYTDDAVLVVQPGRKANGKNEIRTAFEAIAQYFRHGLKVEQAEMRILETGNTAIVLAKTLISAPDTPLVERKATYVFTKSDRGYWLCAIDNSYGHENLNQKG